MAERKSTRAGAKPKARKATTRARSSGKQAVRRSPAPLRDRAREPKTPREAHDAQHFGAAPSGATHFCMSRMHQDGTRERLSIAGREGVAVEHFPLRSLSVEQIRRVWGPGSYKGQWMCVKEGRWTGLGTIRGVRILPMQATNGAAAPSRRMARPVNELGEPLATDYAERSAPTAGREPDEVVDLRVKAEREIAKQRLDFEREMFDRRLASERDEQARQFATIREELDDLRRTGSASDEDADPGPWDWLAPFFEKLRPTLESMVPGILEKFAQTKGLPG